MPELNPKDFNEAICILEKDIEASDTTYKEAIIGLSTYVRVTARFFEQEKVEEAMKALEGYYRSNSNDELNPLYLRKRSECLANFWGRLLKALKNQEGGK